MPCYNASAYIQDAIGSVLNQTYGDIEIIVVNDGSTDDTEKKVLSLNSPKVRYFRIANQGQSSASNFGLEQSSGDFIKFFDADDIMNATHIEEQLTVFNGDDTALSCCSWARFYEDDLSTAEFLPEKHWRSLPPVEWIKASMSNLYDMMPAWCWLIPKPLIEKSGGWQEELSLNNDFEFSIRLVLHASYVHFTPAAKIYYRAGKQLSLSSIESKHSFHSAILSSKLGCSYLLQREDNAATRLLCANKFSYWLYRLYPHYPDLVEEVEKEIRELGGTNRMIDESRLMHLLHSLIGWKAAKRLKMFFYRLGYERYLVQWKKRFFPPSISHR